MRFLVKLGVYCRAVRLLAQILERGRLADLEAPKNGRMTATFNASMEDLSNKPVRVNAMRMRLEIDVNTRDAEAAFPRFTEALDDPVGA